MSNNSQLGPFLKVSWGLYRINRQIAYWQENGSSTWSEESDLPRHAALLGHLYLNGCPFHVEAIQVHVVDGLQCAVDDAFDDKIDHALAICGDGPFATTKIPPYDGDYVVVIHPFAE